MKKNSKSGDGNILYESLENMKMPGKRKKVFVAMSGGVDSSVSAALLSAKGGSASGGKNSGFDVYGVHMKMWSDPSVPCATKRDRYDAMRAAAAIGIPFKTWDFTSEYKREVVDYMIREYAAGRTPNPDVMCNRHIKFGLFLRRAIGEGADYVATGHYVRLAQKPETPKRASPPGFSRNPKPEINKKSKTPNYKLAIARDLNKDQSYFLWTLTQKQIRHCLFPIGGYTKPEVREMARKLDLPTAEKPDSQGICFIGEIDIRKFLKNYIPERRGRILTTAGKTVGEHCGTEFYTIGQREGIGIGGGMPYYVAEKNMDSNVLTVAEGPYDEKLFQNQLTATDINWISGLEPAFPLRCKARIRYRQPLQRCIVNRINNYGSRIMGNGDTGSIIQDSIPILHVAFGEPQRAVTPGQSIVFYSGEQMLGGAIIR